MEAAKKTTRTIVSRLLHRWAARVAALWLVLSTWGCASVPGDFAERSLRGVAAVGVDTFHGAGDGVRLTFAAMQGVGGCATCAEPALILGAASVVAGAAVGAAHGLGRARRIWTEQQRSTEEP